MKAIELLHVRYQVTDLDRLEAFLVDFGLTRIARSAGRLYMGGRGAAPYLYEATLGGENRFVGAAFAVGSREDLRALAALPGSGPVEAAAGPGGGMRVRLRMADGFEIDAVFGHEPSSDAMPAPAQPFNTTQAKPRVNASVRRGAGIAPVRRLGHVVLHVREHDTSVAWLQQRFGLLVSDRLAVPGDPDRIIGSFLRVDGGATAVDHHCLLVLQADAPGVHHCSFEVDDLDAVMSAHDHLLSKGYALDCGVGRHLLGSQVFDYWRDPFGFRIEHYTDGDVVNHEHRPSVFAGTADETTQWGAKPPEDFFA